MRTEVGALAESPTRMARRIVDMESEQRYTTYVVVGLCFLVWVMLMSRR